MGDLYFFIQLREFKNFQDKHVCVSYSGSRLNPIFAFS